MTTIAQHTTFALNSSWDSYADDLGNIATLTGAPAIAQDIASACRLFLNDAFYDKDKGIPYLQDILAKKVPLSVVAAQLESQALTVPNVDTAQAILRLSNRTMTGTINATLTDGTSVNVNI